jgi:hypothetical protein
LRRPRYAVAILVGVGYLSLLFLGQRQGDDAPVSVPAVQFGGTLLLAVLALKWWLFGADRLALAFNPAEIQFLFPAPVSRAALLGFKLVRAQLMILVNVLIWVVLLHRRRESALPLPLYAASLWAIFSTLFLHRLGVALTRDSLTEHGRAGFARNWIALGGLAIIAVIVGLSVQRAGAGLDPDGPVDALRTVYQTPPLSWALYPFRIPFLPLGADSISAWVPRFLAALGLVALHAWWVLRADRAFEEAAVEASARRAELIERWRHRGAGPRATRARARQWLRLAPSGHPIGAVIWKNVTRMVRTASPGVAVTVAVMAATVVGFTVLEGANHEDVTGMIATLALSWLGVLALLGPQWVRIDLRGDLEHLSALRTWPMSGNALMTGEVLSSTLVLTAMQSVLAVVGLVALAQSGQAQISGGLILALSVPALLLVTTLNLVAFAIQNGGALFFPSWVRTEIRPGGVEAMGQHLLTAGVSLLLLTLTLLGPGAIAAGAAYVGWPHLGLWSLVPAFLIGSAGLGLEAFLLLDWLGTRFERLDPTDLG